MVLRDSASAAQGVHYLKTLGAAAVKVWFIVQPGSDFPAMERAVMAAGREARAAGLPLIVHATRIKGAKGALPARAALLVHSVDDANVDAEFLAMARRNHTIYCPTLTVRGGYVRMSEAVNEDRAPAIDDPTGAVDSLTRARVLATAAEARRLHATMR